MVEPADTIKQAKARVKYMMTKEYQQSAEMNFPIRYAQITVDDECVYDFFAKVTKGIWSSKKLNKACGGCLLEQAPPH